LRIGQHLDRYAFGDRDAVDHPFVLWADCDGEGRPLASLS